MEGDGKEKGGRKLGGTNLRVQLLPLALRTSAVGQCKCWFFYWFNLIDWFHHDNVFVREREVRASPGGEEKVMSMPGGRRSGHQLGGRSGYRLGGEGQVNAWGGEGQVNAWGREGQVNAWGREGQVITWGREVRSLPEGEDRSGHRFREDTQGTSARRSELSAT